MASDTNAALKAEPLEPVVPGRFRAALVHSVDDLMEEGWAAKFGQAMFEKRSHLVRGGDAEGVWRYNWEIVHVDRHEPDLVGDLRGRIIEEAVNALGPCLVPEFDVEGVECHATMHHHGNFFSWHDDADGYTGGDALETRRLAFAYYMHSKPKMFDGGELEFLDGTAIEPRHNRLAFWHPIQKHRVRPVECWSSHVLHGRWSVMGWLHGQPPEGWVDRIPKLRDRNH